jgi:hypothetical protein
MRDIHIRWKDDLPSFGGRLFDLEAKRVQWKKLKDAWHRNIKCEKKSFGNIQSKISWLIKLRMGNIYTVVVEEDDNGDIIVPLPKELSNGPHPWLLNDEIIIRSSGTTITVTNMSWLLRNEDGFG